MNWLAKRRQIMGITQRELARLAGVSKSAVAAWETDFRRVKPLNRDKLCAVLRIAADDPRWNQSGRQGG